MTIAPESSRNEASNLELVGVDSFTARSRYKRGDQQQSARETLNLRRSTKKVSNNANKDYDIYLGNTHHGNISQEEFGDEFYENDQNKTDI